MPRVVVESLGSVTRAGGTEPRDSAALCPVTMTTSSLCGLGRWSGSRRHGHASSVFVWSETASGRTGGEAWAGKKRRDGKTEGEGQLTQRSRDIK